MARGFPIILIAIAAICGGLEAIIGLLAIVFIGVFVFSYLNENMKNKPAKTHNRIVHPETKEIVRLRETREPIIDQWCASKGIYDWDWLNAWTTAKIQFVNDEIRYEGVVSFAEEGDPDYHDQPRVKGCESIISGTDVIRKWAGMELKKVPLSSIQKNIANSFKNDKKVRKIIEEAYSECLEKGTAVIDLDDIDLDFTDSRVTKEFIKTFREKGGFSDAHLQENGHTFNVFVSGEVDPV